MFRKPVFKRRGEEQREISSQEEDNKSGEQRLRCAAKEIVTKSNKVCG